MIYCVKNELMKKQGENAAHIREDNSTRNFT